MEGLSPKLRAKAYRVMEMLRKHGNDLKEPYVKPVKGKYGKDLYELRIKFANKKTMKTPVQEIIRAKEYMEDYKRRVSQ